MSQDEKGNTSTLNLRFGFYLVGAIGIGVWFLTVGSDFLDSGISPVYAVFFFVPICSVFLVVIVLAEVVKSLSGSKKNKPELSVEDNPPISKEVTILLLILSFLILILFIILFFNHFLATN